MLRLSFLQLFARNRLNLTYPYSLFFGFLCGSLLTLWLTTYVVNRGQHFEYRHMTDNFGQIMATMAAQEAMDSTLNHDRLSLQILLEDITQHRIIVNAAIYDVEQKLIVQAGATENLTKDNVRHFSAPIALDNTISGNIVLAIDTTYPSSIHYTVVLILITSILASLALLCLYRGIIGVTTTDNRVKPPTTDLLRGDDENNTNDTILLTFDIKNINTLHQRLNSDLRKTIIDHLFQHIQKALSLYNGTLIYIGSNSIALSFERHNAIFNAICCGYIVCELNKKQGNFSLILTARIHNAPQKITVNKQLLLLRNNAMDDTAGLTIEKVLLKDNDLGSYLLINSEEKRSPFIKIRGFQTAYAELLDNQLKHLYAID
jgi:uncharacterized membrane protein affecting hemolysin expression